METLEPVGVEVETKMEVSGGRETWVGCSMVTSSGTGAIDACCGDIAGEVRDESLILFKTS